MDIVVDVKRKRCEWVGHLERMDLGRVVKKIFESKMDRERRMGKSRLTCFDDAEKVKVKVER